MQAGFSVPVGEDNEKFPKGAAEDVVTLGEGSEPAAAVLVSDPAEGKIAARSDVVPSPFNIVPPISSDDAFEEDVEEFEYVEEFALASERNNEGESVSRCEYHMHESRTSTYLSLPKRLRPTSPIESPS